MLSGIGLFKGIMSKMHWLDQNQRTIAQNVANSDTPEYRPQTLKAVDFKSHLGPSLGAGASRMDVSLGATNSNHFGAEDMNGKLATRTGKQKLVYESSPDNNGVVLEEQLFKANENRINHQLATDLYRRNVGMIRMVVQGGR